VASRAADGSIFHSVDLIDIEVPPGVHGAGSWLSGRDRGGAVEFQFLLNGDDGHELRLTGVL
jgi:hypothetical protein